MTDQVDDAEIRGWHEALKRLRAEADEARAALSQARAALARAEVELEHARRQIAAKDILIAELQLEHHRSWWWRWLR